MKVLETETDLTRTRLVDAAAAVFSERGFDKAGVQEIARRAGLTTGAIYSRFTGKAQLLHAALEAHCADELDDLFNQHGFSGHAADIFVIAGEHLVEPDPDEDDGGALLLEAFVAARRDPEVRQIVRTVLEERADRLREVVEAAKLDGTVDESVDSESIVRFAHAVGLGFLLYEAVEIDLPAPGPWAQLITRLVASVAPSASSTETHKGD
ncbi:MAG: TetR/AcrR family transcriptional regulator [Acidimicrobiales bacterium]